MSVLELDDVHSYYGNIHALMGISLKVEQGEIVALIGANGAGKTTTLRSISGLLHPRKGKVLLEGKEIRHLPAHIVHKAGLGLVPEGRGIFPGLTVAENLEMGAYILNDRDADPAGHRERLQPVPPAEGAGPAEGRHPVRRRAADAGHRPGPHVQPQDPAHGRAVHGPGAGAGGPDLRHHQGAQRPRAPPSCWWSRTP